MENVATEEVKEMCHTITFTKILLIVSLGAAESAVANGVPAPRGGDGGRCRVLWVRHHDSADYNCAAISKPTARVIAGTSGQPAQVELIALEGSGEPDWVFAGTKFYVAAAREADVFAALDYDETAQTVTVYKWHASSAVPDWSYTILSCTLVLPDKALVVSADGSTLCVLVQKESDPIYSRMYCFDADSGSVLCTHNSPDVFMPFRVAVSRYGDYIAYTAIDIESPIPSGRIFTIKRDSCNNYWTGIVFSLGSGLCVSPDGEYLAHDVFRFVPPGFELVMRKWRDFPPGYYVECSHDQSDYMPITFACSWDFSTLVSGWASEDEPSKVKLFEMADCDGDFPPFWTYNYPSNGDVPVDAAVTTDGAYAAVGNWTDPDTNPEVLVFEHASSQPIGTVDTPDDVVDVDIGTATCGGAHVAACASGDLYMLRVWEGVIIVYPDGSDTIQEAIDAASDGYLIELADGVFGGPGNVNLDFEGKAITVRSQSGDPASCVIDCIWDPLGITRGFLFDSAAEGPCSVLDGVTITNGSIGADDPRAGGGAIHCSNASSPIIRNCHIVGNVAHGGGGICCVYGSSPQILNCLIGGNAGGYGGGIFIEDASAAIERCTISANHAQNVGGGIWGACVPKRTVVWGNCAYTGIADEWWGDGACRVVNCCDDLDPTGLDGFGSCVTYCSTAYGPNIEADPLFCDPQDCEDAPTRGGDYHFHECSPCAPEQNDECGLIGALDPCRPGDADCDADVDHADLGELLAAWCSHPGDERWNACADFDCDGHVGHSDLGILLAHWGEGCP